MSESGDRQISRSSLLRAPRDPHTLTLGAAALAQRRGVVPGPRLCARAASDQSGRVCILHSAFRRAPLVEGRNADAVSCGAPTCDVRPLDPRSCTYVKLPSPRQHHGTRRAHIKRRGQVTHRPYSGARATGGVDSRYLVSGGQVHAHARARAHAHVRRHQPCAL